MEELSKLVDASLAKYGVEPSFDHFLLEWSRWFRCESSFSTLLVAAKPGVFVLAEEVALAADERRASDGGRLVLDVFHIGEAEDLGLALGRLFLPGSGLRERLASKRAFARYAVIEDRAERSLAATLFRRWMETNHSSEESAKATPDSEQEHRSERFIIRFQLQAASRRRKGQTADEIWPQADRAPNSVGGLAGSRLPSGF